jgi:CheY-specific phosphatase CheX
MRFYGDSRRDQRPDLYGDGRETGKTLASEMLGYMEIAEDEIITSAVGELCNLKMGNACSMHQLGRFER